jgi:hypothetical protein
MVNKLRLIISVMAAVALLVVTPALAGATENDNEEDGNSNEHNKVTLCHATGSETHMFEKITVDANGAVSGHAGNDHQNGEDIIPPFTYNDNGDEKSFPGQNWNAAGQATFNNNCVVPTGGQGGETPPPATTPTQQSQSQSQTQTFTTLAVGGSGGASAPQVVIPQGAVNAGMGGGAVQYSVASIVGLSGSLASMAGGLVWANRRQLV